jgi:hypothetical protein
MCRFRNFLVLSTVLLREPEVITRHFEQVSVPGLLPAIMFDGEAHVDCGMMNWLSVDVMSSMSSTTIAVDVASDPALRTIGDSGSPSVWRLLRRGLLVRAATVSGETVAKVARAQADILFTPPLETVDLLDWQVRPRDRSRVSPCDREACARGHIGIAGSIVMETCNFLSRGVVFALVPSRNRSVVTLPIARNTAIRGPAA